MVRVRQQLVELLIRAVRVYARLRAQEAQEKRMPSVKGGILGQAAEASQHLRWPPKIFGRVGEDGTHLKGASCGPPPNRVKNMSAMTPKSVIRFIPLQSRTIVQDKAAGGYTATHRWARQRKQ